MKHVISFLLILAVLISSCAVPQPDSSDVKPSNFSKTEDIVKPIITENKTIDEKEKINDSKPQELSDEQICISMGGSWFYFSNTCVDSCAKARSKEPVLCGQAFTWGCECGPDKCWNGTDCESTIEDKQSKETHATVNDSLSKPSSNKIKIATFNIQIFGKAKREKPDVMDILKKTVRNFDIVAIQEVRDSSETTIQFFLDGINSMPGPDYGVVSGERLGRSSSKEQYAYYYNTETIKYRPNSAYTYTDSNDVFEREPLVAGFSSGVFDFFLINIHTKPEDAFNEINNLDTVVKDAESKFAGEKDFIVLGDFNADCTYFNEKADSSTLERPEYYWAVEDSADTTTKSTVCTYDRIVFKKDATFSDYASSWEVFRFDNLYALNQELTEDVSDHYPVWAEFYTDRDDDNK